MDEKDKSLFDSVADTIKRTFDIATEAATKALEPKQLKPDEESVVVTAPSEASVSDPAPSVVAIVKKATRQKSRVDTSGRITPAYDIPLPDTPMPSPKIAAKKAKTLGRKTAKKSVQKADKKVA